MKMQIKTFWTAAFACACALNFSATAQVMSIPSGGDVIFNHRVSQTVLNNYWGDLHLDNNNTGSNYGWIFTKQANVT